MRFVAIVLSLLISSGARASVLLPADLVADTNAQAAVWQAAVAAAEPGTASEPSDLTGFVRPTAQPYVPAAGLLPSSVVPDVTSWALLLLGMAIVGLAARQRQHIVTA